MFGQIYLLGIILIPQCFFTVHANTIQLFMVYVVCICIVVYLLIICLEDVISYVVLVVNYFHNVLKTKPFREIPSCEFNKGSNMIGFSWTIAQMLWLIVNFAYVD